MLALGAFFLLWGGVSAYVLTTRAIYDFRHLAFHGARRVVRHWLAHARTASDREAILRRLPRRTLAGIASDARVEADVAALAAGILLEDRWTTLIVLASRHRNEAEKWRRVAALRVFSIARWEAAWPLLRNALRDDDGDVVAAAVGLLGERPEDAATALLVEALAANRFQRSRIATHLDTRPANEHLLPLVDHPDDDVRYWAATLLEPAGDAPEVELALAGLVGDSSPTVRAAVAKTFARAGGAAAAAVGRALIGDPAWFVRAHAARALGASGETGLAAALVPLLRDREWWVRAAAKEVLSGSGPDAIPALMSALSADDQFARNGAAEVLFETGALSRWATSTADEPDHTELSRLLTNALAAGESRVQLAALESVDGPARRKIQRLVESIPSTKTA